MCGRYTLSHSVTEVAEHFDAEPDAAFRDAWAERYNIAPSQGVAVVRTDPETGIRRLESRSWGLVPHWSKDPRSGARMINARIETVASKPAYRVPFRRRRCLIPASGFYEWRPNPKGREPHFVSSPDRPLLAFAGLYEHWTGDEDRVVDSCTILTREACPDLVELHHRMPVILPRDRFAGWLDTEPGDPDELLDLLEAPPPTLRFHPVSLAVNRPRNDSPQNVLPQPGLFDGEAF